MTVKLIKILFIGLWERLEDCLAFLLTWFGMLTVRRWLHWSRMKHIRRGRDWRFYEAQSIGEIASMKLDGTEDQKLEMWCRNRGARR